MSKTYTTQNELLLMTLLKYYKEHECLDTILPIINGEANISIRPEKQKELGTKVEVKNLNSFRTVGRAIEYEVERQTKVLEAGDSVVQETRGWDESKQETFSQREKEEAHDYRYFPEPDLPPLSFSTEFIEEIRHELPELL